MPIDARNTLDLDWPGGSLMLKIQFYPLSFVSAPQLRWNSQHNNNYHGEIQQFFFYSILQE